MTDEEKRQTEEQEESRASKEDVDEVSGAPSDGEDAEAEAMQSEQGE